MQDSLFTSEKKPKNNYEKISCERCHAICDGFYILSSKTKGLWVKCSKCGTHAMPYIVGLRLPWKPSKPFIKEVGFEEAIRLSEELEKNNGVVTSRTDLTIGGNPKPQNISKAGVAINGVLPSRKLYCDAGTRNNGQKGKQDTVVVVCNEKGEILLENWIGDFSNNEGEIQGIIACLRDYSDEKPVHVFTDSQIARNWAINGWTPVHQKRLEKEKLTSRHKSFIESAHELYIKTGSTITWIPREENLAGHYIEAKTGL